MCYHNYTQHNGCGHIGETHTTPWTLCASAEQRLTELRGGITTPLLSPTSIPSPTLPQFTTPSRTSSSKLTKRLTSLGLSRAATTSSNSSSTQRSISGPAALPSSNYANAPFIPDHQLAAVKCASGERRTTVSSEMEVCKECAKWIREMRFLIQRYEKTGSVKGTRAFEEFLRGRGDGGEGGCREF